LFEWNSDVLDRNNYLSQVARPVSQGS
jgi:hypothetical protein